MSCGAGTSAADTLDHVGWWVESLFCRIPRTMAETGTITRLHHPIATRWQRRYPGLFCLILVQLEEMEMGCPSLIMSFYELMMLRFASPAVCTIIRTPPHSERREKVACAGGFCLTYLCILYVKAKQDCVPSLGEKEKNKQRKGDNAYWKTKGETADQ